MFIICPVCVLRLLANLAPAAMIRAFRRCGDDRAFACANAMSIARSSRGCDNSSRDVRA